MSRDSYGGVFSAFSTVKTPITGEKHQLVVHPTYMPRYTVARVVSYADSGVPCNEKSFWNSFHDV